MRRRLQRQAALTVLRAPIKYRLAQRRALLVALVHIAPLLDYLLKLEFALRDLTLLSPLPYAQTVLLELSRCRRRRQAAQAVLWERLKYQTAQQRALYARLARIALPQDYLLSPELALRDLTLHPRLPYAQTVLSELTLRRLHRQAAQAVLRAPIKYRLAQRRALLVALVRIAPPQDYLQ